MSSQGQRPSFHQSPASSSKNLTLPPIGRSTITQSSLKPSDHAKKTIETEFGTIIVDGEKLTVHSENATLPVAPVPTAILVEPDGTRQKKSVMITSVLPESPAEELEVSMAVELSRRQETGMWTSSSQMIAFALSSFLSFRCAVRWPRLWLQFNGGAFIVAFAVCQLVLTMPLLLLEAALGQFAGHGMAGFMPEMAPALRGFPNCLLFCLVVKLVFWMDSLGTVGIYVLEAFEYRPCWMNCNESFHSDACFTPTLDETCQSRGALLFALDRCVERTELCHPTNSSLYLSPTLDRLSAACVHLQNGSTWINHTALHETRQPAAVEYFYEVHRSTGGQKRVHKHGRGILSLLVCWLMLALACQGGFDLVVYTLPLLLGLPACIALAIGINEMLLVKDLDIVWDHLVPSPRHMSDYKCWLFAATASLLSSNLGVGFNSLIYARNSPKHDCLRSAFTLVVINFTINTLWCLCCTILLARNANAMGKGLKDLLQEYGNEPDLIMLTSSLGQENSTQAWLAFFLLTALLLSMGTSQAAVLVIETSLRELSVIGTTSTRGAVCLICTVGFILDVMIYFFNHGPSLNAAVSAYANSYFNIVLALTLVCAVNVALDPDRLLDAMAQLMAVPLGRLRWFWALSWRFLCPLVLLGMFVSSVWHHATHPLAFRGEQLSAWAAVVAVVLAVAPLLLLLVEVFRVYAEVGSDAEGLYRPTERWQLGLLPSKRRDSMCGGGGGSRSGGIGAAKSLMTRMYGAISSRWLVSDGAVPRLESRVAPLDTGPTDSPTKAAPGDDAPQESEATKVESTAQEATKDTPSASDLGQPVSKEVQNGGSHEVLETVYGSNERLV